MINSILDRYILKALLPAFIFYLAICTIFGELIGISFEQVKFVVEQDLPLKTVFLVHLFKLPSFVAKAMPFALLIATISVYGRLSRNNEVAALQSFGVGLIRLILPSLAIAFLASTIMFAVGEVIVPSANYQAAMLLEREWNVDRTKLAKYNNRNIIYQEFEHRNSSNIEDNKPPTSLHKLFYAESFDGQKMRGVTLIEYQNAVIERITIANSARWIEQQQWQFSFGIVYHLDSQSVFSRVDRFELLPVTLTKNAIDYVRNNRDDREMNIIALYQQLAITKQTNNSAKVRQLKISIQSRYALSFTCAIFAFLGSTIGLCLQTKVNNNSLGIALIIIFAYYSTQFISTSLALTDAITVFWGVWLPNLFCFFTGCYRLANFGR